jgi:hypothetical protein
MKRQSLAPRVQWITNHPLASTCCAATRIFETIVVAGSEKTRSLGNGVSAEVPRFSCNNIRAINVVISITVAINHSTGAALLPVDRDGAGVIDETLSLADYIVERTRLVRDATAIDRGCVFG